MQDTAFAKLQIREWWESNFRYGVRYHFDSRKPKRQRSFCSVGPHGLNDARSLCLAGSSHADWVAGAEKCMQPALTIRRDMLSTRFLDKPGRSF